MIRWFGIDDPPHVKPEDWRALLWLICFGVIFVAITATQ
jgi:hypothetical protein